MALPGQCFSFAPLVVKGTGKGECKRKGRMQLKLPEYIFNVMNQVICHDVYSELVHQNQLGQIIC